MLLLTYFKWKEIDASYLDQDNVPAHPLCWSGRESVGLLVPGLLPPRQSQPVNMKSCWKWISWWWLLWLWRWNNNDDSEKAKKVMTRWQGWCQQHTSGLYHRLWSRTTNDDWWWWLYERTCWLALKINDDYWRWCPGWWWWDIAIMIILIMKMTK